jgi:hypothetical protein
MACILRPAWRVVQSAVGGTLLVGDGRDGRDLVWKGVHGFIRCYLGWQLGSIGATNKVALVVCSQQQHRRHQQATAHMCIIQT